MILIRTTETDIWHSERTYIILQVWAENGWLKSLGALDYAGGAVVHLTSGTSGLVACIILGPRTGTLLESTEAALFGRVKAQFTLKNAVCYRRRLSHTAF